MKRAVTAAGLTVLLVAALVALVAAPALAAPGAVSGLTSAAYSSGSFTFTWNPVKGIAGYAYRFDQNASSTAGTTIAMRAPSFSIGSALTTGTSPRQAVTGDFGNGHLDMAVVNATSATVRVLMGNGNGGFTVGNSYATGAQPQSIATGDFNGDGRPDLAVANYNSATVSVFLGTGTGTFAAKVDFATGSKPHGIAVGDLGNGQLDLVVPNAGSNTVSVLLGNGNGTFQPKVDYTAGAHPEKAVIGDFDGDGHPDLAVINNAGDTVSMFLGNGDGTFTAGSTFATGTTPYWVAAGDLDGDGHLDLAVADFGANTVSVLRGKGDGTFAGKVDYATGTDPICVAITDVNGDGDRDLVVSDHGASNVDVLLGRGDGTFLSAQAISTDTTPRFLAVADFDGDGQPDLAVPFDTLTTVKVLRNTTNSATRSVTETASAEGTYYFHVCAIDVDGNAGPTTTRKVVVDTTPPTTTDDAPTGWQGKAVTVDFTATDDGSGMSGGQAGTWYSVDGGSYAAGSSVTLGNGSHTLSYYSRDAAGNAESTKTVSVKVDTAAPTTTDDAPDGWQDNKVTVTLKPTDAGSGMSGGQAGTWYSVDGGTYVAGTSVTLGNGAHTLSYYSKDAIGNQESKKTVSVKVDVTPPTTTDNAPTSWQNHAVTVTLSASDEDSGMSGGKAGTWYSLDGGSFAAGTSVVCDGPHTLRYYSRDAAGNQEPTRTVAIKVDTTPPTTSDNAPDGWQDHALTVKLKATDAGSGMTGGGARTQYSLDGGAYATGTSVAIGNGVHTLTYFSRDAVGNTESAKTVTIRVDTRGPTTSALGQIKVRRGKMAKFWFRVNDATPKAQVVIKIFRQGHVKKTLVVGSRATGTDLAYRWRCGLAKGTYRWVVYARDQAGNRQTRAGWNLLIVV